MTDGIEDKYLSWISSISSSDNASLLDFLHLLGFKKVIWFVLSQTEIHLIEYSENISDKFVELMKNDHNYDKIKKWMKNTLNDQLLEIGDSDHLVLYVKQNKYGNLNFVISENDNPKIQSKLARIWTKIVMDYIEKLQSIKSLESALRIGYSNTKYSEISDDVSNITLTSIKPSFISDVIPHIFYSLVHEAYGPFIFDSIPEDLQSPDNVITAVKLFSGLDSDMVAEVGHVFTSNPIKSPIMGEIFSVIFTLPNNRARGNFEVHALSIIIPQEFFNLSKSLIGEFKTRLFMAIEKIRMTHEVERWGLAVEEMGTNEEIKNDLNPIMEQTRSELALSYALQMEPDDVINW